MKYLRIFAVCLAFFLLIPAANAQTATAEVTITLNEQFFDALLDAMFQSGGPPEIPIAKSVGGESGSNTRIKFGFDSSNGKETASNRHTPCSETIKLLRENQSVRTAVRFREGKIYAPLAFSGNYNPPLVGCIEFSGFAETNIDLEFDRQSQRLIGRVKVVNVSLNGTAGIGSGVITRLVQSSIDKRLNPIELIKLEKLSFAVPIQNSSVRMEAAGIRSEIANGSLLIHVDYNFTK